MNLFEEISRRLTATEGTLRQMVRVGHVVERFPAEARVRVRLEDSDCMDSYKLPVLVAKTRCDKDYWMPDLGEHVICLFLPIGHEVGFVLGSIYSDLDVVPVVSNDKRHVRFEDGTWVEYDRQTGDMNVQCKGKLTIKAAEIEIRAGEIIMTMPQFVGPGEPDIEPVIPSPPPVPQEWLYD
ncbi:MAG: phage baseplate assembly protein V [Deltaproteobacteria bacterium]|nr:phage baseplate assembly protein V [Deltaproteobacteria bacterium]